MPNAARARWFKEQHRIRRVKEELRRQKRLQEILDRGPQPKAKVCKVERSSKQQRDGLKQPAAKRMKIAEACGTAVRKRKSVVIIDLTDEGDERSKTRRRLSKTTTVDTPSVEVSANMRPNIVTRRWKPAYARSRWLKNQILKEMLSLRPGVRFRGVS